MNPIYEPKGKAKEYGDYALNIYTGCPHKCFYCFAPNVLHTTKEKFHSCISPRKNIIEETKKQIERQNITGKTIHLCLNRCELLIKSDLKKKWAVLTPML